jgi:hypothetical protein
MRAKSAPERKCKEATKSKPPARLSKSPPFVPKIINLGGAPFGNQNALGNEGGRPSEYEGEITCAVAKALAQAGCSEALIARTLGIAPSTLCLWKAQHVEFLNALKQGEEQINEALKATAVQRALGYSYETEKAFQTGVKVTVTETLPPSEKMLQFLLERRMPDQFREQKDVNVHHGMTDLVRTMNDRVAIRRKEIEKEVLQLRLQEKRLLQGVTIIEPEVKEVPQASSG